jgi:hypothetical protein
MKGNLSYPVLKIRRWGDLPAEFNLADYLKFGNCRSAIAQKSLIMFDELFNNLGNGTERFITDFVLIL